jgi:polyhydroxybutyrate depolymerase
VDGVVREALVYAPPQARTNPTPVVFAFHGHGGSMQNVARTFSYQTCWPEAIVVYMQGLNTPGRLTDPEGKRPGWQHAAGDQDDRDLKFFDAVLASLQQDYRVDAKRLYATGHSNGGGFTYLLWAARGDRFAAFAPSASAAAARLQASFKPKPVLHVAGENDALVKFAWQQQTMDGLRKLNQCGEGQPWASEKGCTVYPSKLGAPVVTFIHPGTHRFPPEAPALIVKFFKQHKLP